MLEGATIDCARERSIVLIVSTEGIRDKAGAPLIALPRLRSCRRNESILDIRVMVEICRTASIRFEFDVSRSWFVLQRLANGRGEVVEELLSPVWPGGGSNEMKLTIRIGISVLTSADNEPPTETFTANETSTWRPLGIDKASCCMTTINNESS